MTFNANWILRGVPDVPGSIPAPSGLVAVAVLLVWMKPPPVTFTFVSHVPVMKGPAPRQEPTVVAAVLPLRYSTCNVAAAGFALPVQAWPLTSTQNAPPVKAVP